MGPSALETANVVAVPNPLVACFRFYAVPALRSTCQRSFGPAQYLPAPYLPALAQLQNRHRVK